MEPINIIIAIDKKFIQHAGVMLNSIFVNNPKCKLNIICLYDGRLKELKKLYKFIELKNQKFEYHHINKEKVKGFKVTLHISGATYYRLFLPDILQHIKKGIYLDSDLLVIGIIKKLWEIDLKEYTVGAVFLNNQEYFNGGVLLVDFEKWRKESISKKLVHWLSQNNNFVEFWDQDALNAVLYNKTIRLPKQWNQSELIDPDGIIHFMGSHKPWQYHCQHPNKELYFQYLAGTPWESFKIKEQTLYHAGKQNIKRILNKTGLFDFDLY